MSDPRPSAGLDSELLERKLRALRWTALGALLISAGALSMALVVVLRAPGASSPTAKLDELTVGRLNVVEPDGTPRMIIASRAKFPGIPLRGKEVPHPNRSDLAGILFVNDEGTENGGLVQTGKLDANGVVSAALQLSFDRFRQDQAVQLMLNEQDDEVTAGIAVNDVPSHKVFSIDDLLVFSEKLSGMSPAEREAAVKQLQDRGHASRRRGYFGIRQGSSQLILSDPKGRPRLTLTVSDRGEPSINLLDEAGQIVRTINAQTP